MREKKRKRGIRSFLAVTFLLAGIAGGIYVGGWLMMVKPILTACAAFDAGTLTATVVGITVLKFIFGGTVGATIFAAGSFVGSIFIAD